jgi:hypothetical protein
MIDMSTCSRFTEMMMKRAHRIFHIQYASSIQGRGLGRDLGSAYSLPLPFMLVPYMLVYLDFPSLVYNFTLALSSLD